MSTLPVCIPVGSIVAYAADPRLLPAEWHVCDGTPVKVDTSPDLFKAIGYSNGGSGGVFNLPNLQGRFLRGSEDGNLLPGMVSPWSTGSETKLQVTFDQVPNYKVPANRGTNSYMVEWHDEASWFPVEGGDHETRPINTNLYYIIKIKHASSKLRGDDMPVGAVIPYGGADDVYPDFPAYIRCNGAPIDIAEVFELSKAIGNTFTPNPSPNPKSFQVPDLRGKFIRGVDLAGVNDPDAGSRETAPGGASLGLGTWQHYATSFTNMEPGIWFSHFSKWYHKSDSVKGNVNLANDSNVKTQQWYADAKETRPINVAVNFYISSTDSVRGPKPQNFPIGGIITIPGTPTTSLSWPYWLPCTAIRHNIVDYPELYSVLKNTWGSSDNVTFRVPDLQKYFLRGADVDGVSNGDPDWDQRLGPDGTSIRKGVGSTQKAAVALPRTFVSTGSNVQTLNADINYPTGSCENAKTARIPGSTVDCCDRSGPQTAQLSCGKENKKWANETAPRNVAVRFYIRAK